MQIKIDNNVEIPKQTRTRTSKYPLRQLEVGQSFFVAGTAIDEKTGKLREDADKVIARNLSSMGQQESRIDNRKRFTVRVQEEEHEVDGEMKTVQGARIWRIEDRTDSEVKEYIAKREKLKQARAKSKTASDDGEGNEGEGKENKKDKKNKSKK